MKQSARFSPARRAAFEVLFRVQDRDSYAAELLHSNLLAKLSSADRGLATELVMGVLRWQQMLDNKLQAAAQKSISRFDPEVKIALRLGVYQILFLDRIPARAAVNESVELVKQHGKRSAAPLVNAVLRKMSPRSISGPAPQNPAEIADVYSHPEWLVDRWAKNFGLSTTRAICEYNQQRPSTVIRIIPSAKSVLPEESARIGAADSEHAVLSQDGVVLEPAAIVRNAWRVIDGDLTATSLYRNGRIAVQDEGSQLVALLAQGSRILDCCAAPGGKSAVAAERNPGSLVVSMDLHLHRVRLMKELHRSSAFLAGDARRLPFVEQFDCVIADLPCTGTGTLSRNPEIKWRLTPEDPPRMAALQADMLQSVSSVAKMIVYSTCSLELEEGEEAVERFLSGHPQFRVVPVRNRLQILAEGGAINTESVNGLVRDDFLRTIPGIHECDGFFAAILQRNY